MQKLILILCGVCGIANAANSVNVVSKGIAASQPATQTQELNAIMGNQTAANKPVASVVPSTTATVAKPKVVMNLQSGDVPVAKLNQVRAAKPTLGTNPGATSNLDVTSNLGTSANLGAAPKSDLAPQTIPNVQALDVVDQNAADLAQIKRRLELEKAEAELNRVRNGGNSGGGSISDNSQTVVTGVAINQDGKKIAWLQFADGGSLMVNIGAIVGRYTVTDINMNGVTLTNYSGKKQTPHNVYLKRVYYTSEKSKNQSGSDKSSWVNTPSPILTHANSKRVDDNANDMVPPIVPTR